MSKIYSLCLTTTNIYDNNKYILFRLADRIENELKESNNSDYYSEYDENCFYYPRTFKDNYIIGELRIWEWDPFERDYAKKTNIQFYELIYNSEIFKLSEESIVKKIKEGYTNLNYFGQKALLLIDEDENFYKVLEIDSRIVNTVNGIIKLNNNVNEINGYKLKKTNFILTDRVTVQAVNGEKLAPRKIYKYIKLHEPDFIIDVLSFNEKIEIFVCKQIKLHGISRAKQKEIKNVLNEILSDYDKINEFFIENNFTNDNLKVEINKISDCINDALSEDCLSNKFCEAMIEGIPELTKNFYDQIQRRFLLENKNELKRMSSVILEEENKKNILLKQCEEYDEKLLVLSGRKNELESEIENLVKTCNSLKKTLKDRTIEIKTDMSKFITDIGLLETIGFNKSIKCYDMVNCTVKLANMREDKADIVYDINELIDALALNLQIAGIEDESIYVVSKYIIGSIKQKNNLFITGKFLTNVADAISATICGRKADKITVISPNIKLEEIIEKINICNSKIILIENIVSLNELVTLQILNIDLDKIIIFSNEIFETLNFIPKSFYNYLNLLCADFVSEKVLLDEFDYFDASNLKLDKAYNKFTFRAAKEELCKLSGLCIYSNSHCVTKSELISIINDIGEKEGLYAWLLCEVLPQKIISKEKDDFEDIIDILQLSEKHMNKFKNMIW